jgi:predicted DsbA family dithiol-disulfide isomerase
MKKIKVIIHSLKNCGSCAYGKRVFEESLVSMGCEDKIEIEVQIHDSNNLNPELNERVAKFNTELPKSRITTFPIFEIIEDETNEIHNLTTAITTIYWRTKR